MGWSLITNDHAMRFLTEQGLKVTNGMLRLRPYLAIDIKEMPD